MKVQRHVSIIDLPGDMTISQVSGGKVLIAAIGRASLALTHAQAIEVRDALTVMIDHLSGEPAPASTDPRTWGAGDTVPESVKVVYDKDGDTWIRANRPGWWTPSVLDGHLRVDPNLLPEVSMLAGYGPVTEASR